MWSIMWTCTAQSSLDPQARNESPESFAKRLKFADTWPDLPPALIAVNS